MAQHCFCLHYVLYMWPDPSTFPKDTISSWWIDILISERILDLIKWNHLEGNANIHYSLHIFAWLVSIWILSTLFFLNAYISESHLFQFDISNITRSTSICHNNQYRGTTVVNTYGWPLFWSSLSMNNLNLKRLRQRWIDAKYN